MPQFYLQEELSRCVTKILLYPQEWYLTKPDMDNGIDFTIKPLSLAKGVNIDIQLKSTKQSNITQLKNGNISYDLDVKNYNDLVDRKDEITNGFTTPFLLILCVLDDSETKRVSTKNNQTIINHNTYWYNVDSNISRSSNKSTVSVHLTQQNLIITPHQFNKVLREQYKKYTGRNI